MVLYISSNYNPLMIPEGFLFTPEQDHTYTATFQNVLQVLTIFKMPMNLIFLFVDVDFPSSMFK